MKNPVKVRITITSLSGEVLDIIKVWPSPFSPYAKLNSLPEEPRALARVVLDCLTDNFEYGDEEDE